MRRRSDRDMPARRLEVMVDGSELERRRTSWKPADNDRRGYEERVLQANEGYDFDFLAGNPPS